MKSEVLTGVKLSVLVFSVVTPFGLVSSCNVSEQNNASIFRADITGDSIYPQVLTADHY
jgi:hypothetical protein